MEVSWVPQSPILYQNREKTITLIDIPVSISFAQLLSDQPLRYTLLSCAPLQEPYPSTEPKSEAARENVMSRIGTQMNYLYAELIDRGIEDTKNLTLGDWCLPRKLLDQLATPRGKKRKARSDIELSSHESIYSEEPETLNIGLWKKRETTSLPTLILLETAIFQNSKAIANRLVFNANSAPVSLQLSSPSVSFTIPPRAAFFLTNINPRTINKFVSAVSRFYSTPSASAGPGQFDLILLDPPWQNRSVKRSKEYKTVQDHGPVALIRDSLASHIAPNGLVACWITNREKSREDALEMFEAWEVELIEEWIWAKVTVRGKSVYDVNGLWRKPFEVLLIGRKSQFGVDLGSQTAKYRSKELKRRLILGVPDLHSRKPSVKALMEDMLGGNGNYRALEIFARNLTAGWWALGDEALKFNWAGYWTRGGCIRKETPKIQEKSPNSGSFFKDVEAPKGTIQPLKIL